MQNKNLGGDFFFFRGQPGPHATLRKRSDLQKYNYIQGDRDLLNSHNEELLNLYGPVHSLKIVSLAIAAISLAHSRLAELSKCCLALYIIF